MSVERWPRQRPLRRVIVVAHRLPLTGDGHGGWRRAPGGLVSALEPVVASTPSCWIGHLPAGCGPVPPSDGTIAVVPIELDEAGQRDVIDGYCNRTLWPALHGVAENVEQRDEWWQAYLEHSELTASCVAEHAELGALVWVHDYHHFALAQPLKALRADLRIGLSIHTPFVEAVMSGLDRSPELARRLLQFDLIGTQTEHDAHEVDRFVRSRDSGRSVNVAVTPVGIDVAKWIGFRDDPVVNRLAARARGASGVLAVGVDRIDYTKGLLPKLVALEVALARGTIDPNDIRLVQVAVPSRTTIPLYAYLSDQVIDAGRRINREFERDDGHPVIEIIHHQVAPVELAALMRAADVALITPYRDGMNLVALEFSVLNGDRPSEVILSGSTGAAERLSPFCTVVEGADVGSIAAALEAVVARPLSARRSADRAQAASQLTARRWAARFLRELRHAPPPAGPTFRRAPTDAGVHLP